MIVFAVLTFSGILALLENIVVERLQRRYFARLALSFAESLSSSEAGTIDRAAGIDRANRFFEVVNVQKTTYTLLLDGLALLLQMFFGMALLAVYHPLLLAFDLCLILCLMLIILPWGRSAVEPAVEESKAKLNVGNWMHALAANPAQYTTTEGHNRAILHADELTAEYLKRRRRHFHVLFTQIAGSVLVQILANASVLVIGGWLVIEGQLTLGQLVAAEIVVSSLAAGIGKLGKYLEAFYDLSASTDKISHVLLAPRKRATTTEGGA
jgi:putative ABC transport system ATP-binding protein